MVCVIISSELTVYQANFMKSLVPSKFKNYNRNVAFPFFYTIPYKYIILTDAQKTKPFILANPYPQYNRYIEPKYFKKFTIELGNVVWEKNLDITFPIEQLHRSVVDS